MPTLKEVDFGVLAENFTTIYAYTKYAQPTLYEVMSLNLTRDALREEPLYAPRN